MSRAKPRANPIPPPAPVPSPPPPEPKKFLTICEGGVVRSVSMALVLKHHGQDALAASWRWNTPSTFRVLGVWAHRIILMQPHFIDCIPDDLRDKCRVVDVGEDRYGSAINAELYQFLDQIAVDWKQRGWEF